MVLKFELKAYRKVTDMGWQVETKLTSNRKFVPKCDNNLKSPNIPTATDLDIRWGSQLDITKC